MKLSNRIVAIALTVTMIISSFCIGGLTAFALDTEPENYVFMASKLTASVSVMQYDGIVDGNGTEYLRFSGPAGDKLYTNNTYAKLTMPEEVIAHDYKYIAVGYRTNITTGTGAVAISAGLMYNGTLTRSWGMMPEMIADGNNQKVVTCFDSISGSQAGGSVKFPQIDADSPVSSLRFGVYGNSFNSIVMKETDYFDIEYVAFFKTEAAANSFEFDYEHELSKKNKKYGDVNGDGVVSTLDSVIMARHIAKWNGYDILQKPLNSDLNCDEDVSSLDSVILSRHLANWKGYATMPYLHDYDSYINYREPLKNSLTKISSEGKLNVAYLGGSITAGHGSTSAECWRAYIDGWFRDEYPEADVKMIDASIGGTGSTYGLYRLKQDVLDKDPDLVFIEFAVNDNHGESYGEYGKTIETVQEYYESIIQNIYAYNPDIDIVMLYTASRVMDRDTFTIVAQEELAEHYNINSVYFGQSLLDFLPDDYKTNDEVWNQYFNGDIYHPTKLGYEQLFRPVRELFVNSWGSVESKTVTAKTLPTQTVSDKIHYNPGMIDGRDITDRDSTWTTNDRGIQTATPGASFRYTFTGNSLAVFTSVSSKAGVIDFRIDGGVWQEKSLRGSTTKEMSKLISGLTDGTHTVEIKCSDKCGTNEKVTITALLFN